MTIQLDGYSKTPMNVPLRDPIRFTCIGIQEGYPQAEVLVGAISTIVPNEDGSYHETLNKGIYLIEIQQSGKEWVEQGKVIVDGNTSSPISISSLVRQYPYVPVE